MPVATGLEAARELECAALGALLREPREAERTLLLDCRPFLVAELSPDGPAHVLLAALLHETHAGPTAVCFLRGGFHDFQARFPDLCSEAPGLALPPAEAENHSSDPRAPIHDQGGPVEILPYLFLGSCTHSSDLQGLQACGITAVLNVSASCPNHFEDLLCYKSIPVEDNHMVEISAWFQEAIGFIDSVKNSGGRVLVHCQAGISRSATICLAYLIQSHRVRLDEAFDFVKQRRGVISPNFSFMGQLLQFETQVLCH
uniref:Dual specificity phosphatase 2 n=1 Tax=Jaculus jaculus TaxID=51337 RepID=A0A8C5L6R6_JACJA